MCDRLEVASSLKKSSRHLAEGTKDEERSLLCLDTRLRRENHSMRWGTSCPRLTRPQPKPLDVNGSISMSFGSGSCIGEWYRKGEERAGREWDICILKWSQEVKAWQPRTADKQLKYEMWVAEMPHSTWRHSFSIVSFRCSEKKSDQNAVNLFFTCSAHDLESHTHMPPLRNETFYQMN